MQRYDHSSALLVIDMQNDFADPAGSLHVPGGEEVIDFVNRQVRLAVDAGATVVYTQDWHPPSTPHFARDGGVWPVHCVAGTWGAELVPGLEVAGPVVRKGTGGEDGYSGFTARDPVTGGTEPTDLGSILSERGVTAVTVVGLATDYCVKETALDAVRRGLAATVLGEGVRAVDREPGNGLRAIEELRSNGVAVRGADGSASPAPG